MTQAIGIDLGTTFSVVAKFEDGRCRTLNNSEGDLTTPSVVYFDSDQPIVGKEAVKAGAFEPSRLAYLAKRDMGKDAYHRKILGQTIPPEVVQGIILKKLRADAELQVGDVTQAVITVPAYFNEPRRKATQDAGRLAGLDVLDIINEPTAAAIAFGVQEGFLDEQGKSAKKELILVYDLGGGTFDATLMEIDGGSYRALSTAGDVHLGGVDWDQRIMDHASKEFIKQHELDPRNDEEALQELRREAEEAKRGLSAREKLTITFELAGQGVRVPITRGEFEEMTAHLIDRTRFTITNLLRTAGLEWSDITRLLLVGGSTRMPMVANMLERESGKSIDRSLAADEAVAHGAAIYAGLLRNHSAIVQQNLSVTNVCSHSLGVLGIESDTGRKKNRVMIPANTQLPASKAAPFKTHQDGQKSVAVNVIEGGDASGNNSTLVGKCVVRGLPPGLPANTQVNVQFKYMTNGRLQVTAEVPSVGKRVGLDIERASGLADEDISTWAERIEFNELFADADEGTALPPDGATVTTQAATATTSSPANSQAPNAPPPMPGTKRSGPPPMPGAKSGPPRMPTPNPPPPTKPQKKRPPGPPPMPT